MVHAFEGQGFEPLASQGIGTAGDLHPKIDIPARGIKPTGSLPSNQGDTRVYGNVGPPTLRRTPHPTCGRNAHHRLGMD
jgi:hypothetical protein